VTYVTDTHCLVWFLVGERRLGRSAKRVLQQAADGRATIHVSALSLFEIALLVERGRLRGRRGWTEWLAHVRSSPGIVIEPITIDDVGHAARLRALRDPFDRLIVATALRLGVPLLSADERITASGLVDVVF
jgi:PIN domain nuclease of toxin-antitoxin system